MPSSPGVSAQHTSRALGVGARNPHLQVFVPTIPETHEPHQFSLSLLGRGGFLPKPQVALQGVRVKVSEHHGAPPSCRTVSPTLVLFSVFLSL